VDSIPLEADISLGMFVAGLTESVWKDNAKLESVGENCKKIITKPAFEIKIYFNPMFGPSPTGPGHGGKGLHNSNTAEHERYHAQIYKNLWNRFVELARAYEDVAFCDSDCSRSALIIIRNLSIWHKLEAADQHDDFHKTIGQSIEIDKTRPTQKFTAKLAYEQEINEFNSLKCWEKECN
jgi:hypothetical protein